MIKCNGLLEQYRCYLEEVRENKNETIRSKCSYAEKFLKYIFKNGLFEKEKLKYLSVINFFEEYPSVERKKKFRRRAPGPIKAFLLYLYDYSYIDKNLADFVPKVKDRRYATYNRSLDWDTAQKLMSALPRNTEIDLRNYAIVVLLLYAGLRSCEVLKLKTSYINWENATIKIHSKGDEFDNIPLSNKVAEGIVDYLSIKTNPDAEYLFVSQKDKLSGMTSTKVIRNIVRRAYEESGVLPPGNCRGAHPLRHTFARMLTSEGVPVAIIAKLMRHKKISSTMVYARSNLNSLIKITPEWPSLW